MVQYVIKNHIPNPVYSKRGNLVDMICSLAVRESLANVFGHKFDSFVKNFEKSFRSNLMTLRLINESSQSDREHRRHLNRESNYFSDMTAQVSRNDEHCLTCTSGVRSCQPEAVGPTISSEEHFGILGETEQNTRSGLLNRELALNGGEINQQLACVSSSSVNQSMFSTFERSVIEQTRSNDLKTFEIGLTMKKLQMTEKQLSLHSDLNFLERCKLSMGTKRAFFKAEKFKTELEETRHAELLKKCTDCLVAGLLIMLASIGYGTYVYSHRRITEATASCMPSEESNSCWVPKHVSSFNSGLRFVSCYLQVLSRVIFCLFMILAITYLLLLQSSVSSQTMPVTFILILGVACGFAGKLCIDTLGGSGYHWLLYWEVLCLSHFFSSVRTSDLFHVLYGPISVSHGGAMEKTMFPYWIRRFFCYAIVLLLLPMIRGLVPFASPAEWKDHLSLKVMDLLQPTSEWN
ncbi:protein CPR-5-like isoform X2 [Rhododendron vialii]|uniref:protein CPR-5-like isoform X2 n=2 Tax=Rhododendron vialii TaxID=182163 RepID=UPI00265F1A9B|nr:protein CPR-5-like isoform X2 [Rhododendron vialii]